MSALATVVTQRDTISSTSQHKRDVSEKLRRLNPALTQILALVGGSNVDAWGNLAYSGKGMFKKKGCKRLDPEWFTYTPIDIIYAATGGSSSTAVVADTTYFQVDDTIVNQNTGAVGMVTALTDGTTLAITTIGDTTWSCNAGNYLVLMASAYEEGTARYSNITKGNTRCQTYLQTYREGLTIADTARTVDSYLSESDVDKYKTESMYLALQKLESSCLWSVEGASTGATSVTIGGTAYTIQTMKGLISYAGTAIDMGGQFNWDTWNTTLCIQMPTTINPDETLYAIMGRNIYSQMNMWVQDSHLMTSANVGEQKFGTTVKKFLMGGLEVEPISHRLFDTGYYSDSILFFQSSDIEYLFLEGLDLQTRKNAQNPAAMAQTDIIEGLIGLKSISNGANIKLVKNCLKAA
jgi:hypothetical protein